MIIRAERRDDFDAIRALLDGAFGGPYESKLVDDMRGTDWHLPELTLVAESEGKVVGQVMFSRVKIETIESAGEAIALGPLAVLPQEQEKGVGSRLVQEGLNRLDAAMPEMPVVVLGSPRYYPRFGFEPASTRCIYPPVPWSDDDFMVRSASAAGPRGMVVYPDLWGVEAGNGQVRLRRAKETDMQDVARVFAIAFRHGVPFVPNLHTADEDRAYFTQRVFAEDEVWLAFDNDQLCGFIAFDKSFVHHLYVLPIAQGKGIGERLLQRAKDTLGSFRLWTFQKNDRARAFYKRMGLREIEFTDGKNNEEREPDVLLEF